MIQQQEKVSNECAACCGLGVINQKVCVACYGTGEILGNVECPLCLGDGTVGEDEECWLCCGTGEVTEQVAVEYRQ